MPTSTRRRLFPFPFSPFLTVFLAIIIESFAEGGGSEGHGGGSHGGSKPGHSHGKSSHPGQSHSHAGESHPGGSGGHPRHSHPGPGAEPPQAVGPGDHYVNPLDTYGHVHISGPGHEHGPGHERAHGRRGSGMSEGGSRRPEEGEGLRVPGEVTSFHGGAAVSPALPLAGEAAALAQGSGRAGEEQAHRPAPVLSAAGEAGTAALPRSASSTRRASNQPRTLKTGQSNLQSRLSAGRRESGGGSAMGPSAAAAVAHVQDLKESGGAAKWWILSFLENRSDMHPDLTGYALGIMGPTNPVRVFLHDMCGHWAFDLFVLCSIIISTISLALDSPRLSPNSYTKSAVSAVSLPPGVLLAEARTH